MGYQTEKLKSGALLVKDVPLMGPQTLTEKHFKIKNIGLEWMNAAVARFAENKSKGKMPYLWDRHNSRDQAAKVIGRLDNMRVGEVDGEDWLFADVIITDPAEQQKFLEGKSPSKSVEFQPDNYYLRGLALLDGHEGHFDATIPDFVPEGLYDELVALGLNAECTVLCHSAATTAKGTTMDIEAIKAAMSEVLAPINERLTKLETTKANSKVEDVDAALQQVRDEERAEASVKLAKAQREAKIAAYTAQLAAKTKTPETLLRKKLDSFQTQEGMDEYFKAAMKAASEEVKLGVEREHGDSPDLAEEFANYKANYPNTTHTLDSYKACANYKPKDFSTRKVESVQFA